MLTLCATWTFSLSKIKKWRYKWNRLITLINILEKFSYLHLNENYRFPQGVIQEAFRWKESENADSYFHKLSPFCVLSMFEGRSYISIEDLKVGVSVKEMRGIVFGFCLTWKYLFFCNHDIWWTRMISALVKRLCEERWKICIS